MTVVSELARGPKVKEHQVWDLPVRLFHWTLVSAIIGAFVTNRLGVAYFKYHVWFGYTVIVLVLFRVIWGFVGTHHARFKNFVYGPTKTLQYTISLFRGQVRPHAGHNPLGACMVLVLLMALGTQAVFGLFSNDDIFNTGPLYGYVSKELSRKLTSMHRILFYWIVIAAAIHIVAVIAHQIFDKANLIISMFTGCKQLVNVPEVEVNYRSRDWVAVLLIVALSIGLAWVIRHAPVSLDLDSL